MEEHLNDLRSARADFAAVLKLPTTNSLSVWAHAMARERLAATEAAAKSAATSNPAAAALNRVAAAADFWRRPLAQVLQECNAKPSVAIKLPGAKGAIELNRCYRGREHMSCVVAALLAEANSMLDRADPVALEIRQCSTYDCGLSTILHYCGWSRGTKIPRQGRWYEAQARRGAGALPQSWRRRRVQFWIGQKLAALVLAANRAAHCDRANTK